MYNINEIARMALVRDNRTTLHKLRAAMEVAANCVTNELNIDVTGQLKTVFLKPTSYGTIRVPKDYYSYSKVGLCIGGQVVNLGLNNDLCFPHMTNDCGQLQPETYSGDFQSYLSEAKIANVGWWYYNYNSFNENGEFTGKLYGVGSGYNNYGYYRYNAETREFVLTPNLHKAEAILLEYTATTRKAENIIVPEEAAETVISWIQWKLLSTPAERGMYEREYYNNLMKLRLRRTSFTLDEMIDAIRKSYILSPKG